jgi:hypothetical protein
MHDDRAYVVGVRLEGGDFLGGVVVVDAELEVVTAADDPVLAGYEASRADGNIGQFEGFDDCLGGRVSVDGEGGQGKVVYLSLVRPDVGMAVV